MTSDNFMSMPRENISSRTEMKDQKQGEAYNKKIKQDLMLAKLRKKKWKLF